MTLLTLVTSFQFSLSVMSDSLWPHELQHNRPPCPSPTPRVHSDSRPLSPWCHPAISSWVVPFSSCPQSLPASEFFPMSQLFSWGGQSTGVSGWHKVYEKKSNSEGQGKENVKEYLMRSPKRAEKCTCEISFLNFQLCPNTLILITLNFSSSL